MRLGKRFAYMLLGVAMLTISVLTPMETKAGKSEILMDAQTLETADWNNPERDVEIKDGTLVFPKTSTKYTRFIAKSPAKIDDMSDSIVTLSATIKMEKMPKGGSFVLAFGLSSIESLLGEAGNIEVTFTNDGGIKASIIAYDDAGKEQKIVAPKSCAMAIGSATKVAVDVLKNGQIELTVNGSKIGSGKLPVSGEGRVGFMQTGECSGVVSDIALIHYKYDRPENTNIFEDFEDGELDLSQLRAKMLWASVNSPVGQNVEDYEGNQVLMHTNVGASYIGTVYPYSNFEMTFDVPYLLSKDEFREDGKTAKTRFSKLIVTLGSERTEWSGLQWDLAGEAIVLEYGTVYSNSTREQNNAVLTKNPFEEGKPFSMQVKMVDSIVTIGMKWLEEEKFETVLQYKLRGGTPNGHLHIWVPQSGTFAIDNIKIKNLDDSPNVIETEYRGGKIHVPADYKLEPMDRVYKEVETKTENDNWYLLIPATAVVGIGALAITVLTTRGKKKKKEEAVEDEN